MKCHGLAIGLFVCAGCIRAPYVMPAPRVSSAIGMEPVRRGDTTEARSRVEQARRTCIARGTPAARRLDAVREVLIALSGRCDGSPIGADGLTWHLRCRSDGFFAPRAYVPLPGSRDQWLGAGAALAHASGPAAGITALRVAFVGHADLQSLDPSSPFVPCSHVAPEGHRHACDLGFDEACAWPVLSLADESERARGNEQLAFCRGASAADLVAQGFQAARGGIEGPTAAAPGSTHVPIEIVVAGAGPQWQSLHADDCRDARGESLRCDSARRVDLFLQFVAASSEEPMACPLPASGDGDVDSLACLQDCYETIDPRAAHASEPAASLFEPANAPASGWIIASAGTSASGSHALAGWAREIATGQSHLEESAPRRTGRDGESP